MLRFSGRARTQLQLGRTAAVPLHHLRPLLPAVTRAENSVAPRRQHALGCPVAAAAFHSAVPRRAVPVSSPVAPSSAPTVPPASSSPSTSQPEAGRWLFLADVHFDHKRLDRLEATCAWVLSEVRRLRPRHVFLLGDTLHTRNEVHVMASSAAASFLQQLLHTQYPDGQAHPHVHLLVGNHDMHHQSSRDLTSLDAFAVHDPNQSFSSIAGIAAASSAAASRILPPGEVAPPPFVSSLLPASSLSRLHVYREITLVTIDGQPTLFLPYHHGEDVRQIEEYISGLKSAGHDLSRIVCLAHLPLTGATISGIAQETQTGRKYENASVALSTLAQFKRTFLGHFHIHQLVGRSGRILYVGAPMQFNYGDAGDEEKGFVLYEPRESNVGEEGKQLPWKLYRNPHAAHYFRHDLESLKKELSNSTGAPPAPKDAASSASETSSPQTTTPLGSCIEILLPSSFDAIAQGRELEEVKRGLMEKWGVSDVKVKVAKHETRKEDTTATTEEGDPSASDPASHPVDPLLNDLLTGNLLPLISRFLSLDETLSSEQEKQVRREAMEHVWKSVEKDRAAASSTASSSATSPSFHAALSRLEVTNFLSVQGTMQFDFQALGPGVWYVSGPNGSGKSLLLEALTWCLFGKTLRGHELDRTTRAVSGLMMDEIVNDRVRRDQTGKGLAPAQVRVSVTFANGYTFTRSHTSGVPGSSIRVTTPAGEQLEAKSTKRLDEENVVEILGLSFDRFISSVLLSSTTKNFLVSRSEDKRRVIEDLLGFAQFEALAERAQEVREKVKEEWKAAGIEVRLAEDKLEESKKAMGALEQQRVQLRENVTRASKELEALTTACLAQASSLATLESQSSVCSASRATASASLSSVTQELDQLRSGEEHRKAQQLRKEKDRAESDLKAEVKKRLSTLQASHSSITSQLHQAAKKEDEARMREATQLQRKIADLAQVEHVRGQLDLARAKHLASTTSSASLPGWLSTLTGVVKLLEEWILPLLPQEGQVRERFLREILQPLKEILSTSSQASTRDTEASKKLEQRVGKLEEELRVIEEGRDVDQERRDLPAWRTRQQELLKPRPHPSTSDVASQQASDPLHIQLRALEAQMDALEDPQGMKEIEDERWKELTGAVEMAAAALQSFDASIQSQLAHTTSLQQKRQRCEAALRKIDEEESEWRRKIKASQAEGQRVQVQKAKKEQEVENWLRLQNQLETDVKERQLRTTALEAGVKELHASLDACAADLSAITYWSDRLSDAPSRQKLGFRTFCIERVLNLLNPLVEKNLEWFSQDESGAVVHPLGARLTAELNLVALPGATSMEKRSEGQRKRTHLALFLALFELSQRRSSFQNRFLFLDEAFDSLDEEGQKAVSGWIKQYATGMDTHAVSQDASSPAASSPDRPHVFVITHSPYTSPSISNGCIHVRLDPVTRASRYELDAHAGAALTKPFVVQQPMQPAEKATTDAAAPGELPPAKVKKPRAPRSRKQLQQRWK
jgi:DNA repair exonuclease SbcCD ATPase subunit